MDMHLIHLVLRHRIYLFLQEVDTAEMPGYIEVQSSIWESWRICYLTALYLFYVPVRCDLIQGLARIEDSGISRSLDSDSFLSDLDAIAFRMHALDTAYLHFGFISKHIDSVIDYIFRRDRDHDFRALSGTWKSEENSRCGNETVDDLHRYEICFSANITIFE